jgi:hypothetical protein
MPDTTELLAADVLPIIQSLLQATRTDRIEWEEGFDDSTFQVVFKGGIVRIRRVESGSPSCAADFIAPSGTTVAVYNPNPNDPAQNILQELYDLARASALKPRHVLQEILREINEHMSRPSRAKSG